jgi:hypothetical protein
MVVDRCYSPNGTPLSKVFPDTYEQYVPCSSSGYSMCCATNRTSGADSCLPNGLCVTFGSGNFWRESCTDKTWKSPACVRLCTDDNGKSLAIWKRKQKRGFNSYSVPGATSSSDAWLTPCNDGTFCCGHNNTDCCNAQHGYTIASVLPTVRPTLLSTFPPTRSSTSSTFVSTMPSLSSSLATSTTASSTSVANTEATEKTDGHNKTVGAIAGGVIGGVGLAAFSALLIIIYRKRRMRGHGATQKHASMMTENPMEREIERHEMM